MFMIYDYINNKELYSLCPHSNDILNLTVREYFNLKIPKKIIKRKLSSILDVFEDEKLEAEVENPLQTMDELSYKNNYKMIISGGRDRNIIISDVVNMRKLGQITLKHCSMDGYKFVSLRR